MILVNRIYVVRVIPGTKGNVILVNRIYVVRVIPGT